MRVLGSPPRRRPKLKTVTDQWESFKLGIDVPLFQAELPPRQGVLRNLFRFETTETGTETSFGTIRNKTFASVVSLLYRNRDFRLNRNEQKTNRNSLIGSIFFFIFYRFFLRFFRFFRFSVCVQCFFVFLVFSICFETVCFGCFASIPKQRVLIEPKQAGDPTKQFKREYICEFFRKFRVVLVCFGYGFETLKQTEFFLFGFTKQTETNAKQILFSVCFGSKQNLFLFVSRTPYSQEDLW